jgi:hypothetical protein
MINICSVCCYLHYSDRLLIVHEVFLSQLCALIIGKIAKILSVLLDASPEMLDFVFFGYSAPADYASNWLVLFFSMPIEYLWPIN